MTIFNVLAVFNFLFVENTIMTFKKLLQTFGTNRTIMTYTYL